MKKIVLLAILVFSLGCGDSESTDPEKDYLEGFVNPKSDAATNSRLIGTITSRGDQRGWFESNDAIGYTVVLGKGAKFDVSLSTKSGTATPENKVLDTAILMYGPIKGANDVGELQFGELLVATDNTADSLAAPDLNFVAPELGEYLLVIAAEEVFANSSYRIAFDCEGDEEQCRMFTECQDDLLLIEHSVSDLNEPLITLEKDTVWTEGCEVLLDAPLIIPKGVTLRVEPGVVIENVRGKNVIGVRGGTAIFEGTEIAPIQCNSCFLTVGGEDGGTFSINHLRSEDITQIVQGSGTLTIRDSILNNDEAGWNGTALSINGGEFEMYSSLITGYATGIVFGNTNDARVEHSYIVRNETGVRMEGENAISTEDIEIGKICGDPGYPPLPVDPVIVNSEINKNNRGIVVQGQDILFEIESSNLVDNEEHAVQIFAHQIHPNTFFKGNNIMGNNSESALERQFETYHHMNALTLDGNFIPTQAQVEPWASHCLGEINETNPATAKLLVGPSDMNSQAVKDAFEQALLNP